MKTSDANAVVGKVWYLTSTDDPGVRSLGLIFYQSQCGQYWGGIGDCDEARKAIQIGVLCRSINGGGALPINIYHNSTIWNKLRELARTNSLRPPDLTHTPPEPPPTTIEARAKRFALVIKA